MTAHQVTDHQKPSSSFSKTIKAVEALALETFQREIESKQLYYHGIDHVEGVARRAALIFDTVVPFYGQERSNHKRSNNTDWNRQRELLQLSAIAHDMLQIFHPQASPQSLPQSPRQRRNGESEQATIRQLFLFLKEVDTSKDISKAGTFHHFTPADISVLEEAIRATICQYDASDSSIYQPWLYAKHRNGKSISLVARCLALADIGTLGIEGIEAYSKEGSLLLLEENLDIISFLKNESGLDSRFDDAFRENVRQRLLKRARFEVDFARGRLNRLEQELAGLPSGAIAQLKQKVFKHLTPETIQTLEAIIPTANDTALSQLIDYFRLKRYVQEQNL
ncbi:MAG: hypothetical protein AAFZ17_20180 [Cyanobacteria bacterium J06650_10]